MKNRRYSKLKRNPLVRLIRWVLRFFNDLFKPKKSISSSSHFRHSSNEYRRVEPLTSTTKLESCDRSGLTTVGELLDRVNWQFYSEIDPEIGSDTSLISRTHDVSRN